MDEVDKQEHIGHHGDQRSVSTTVCRKGNCSVVGVDDLHIQEEQLVYTVDAEPVEDFEGDMEEPREADGVIIPAFADDAIVVAETIKIDGFRDHHTVIGEVGEDGIPQVEGVVKDDRGPLDYHAGVGEHGGWLVGWLAGC